MARASTAAQHKLHSKLTEQRRHKHLFITREIKPILLFFILSLGYICFPLRYVHAYVVLAMGLGYSSQLFEFPAK